MEINNERLKSFTASLLSNLLVFRDLLNLNFFKGKPEKVRFSLRKRFSIRFDRKTLLPDWIIKNKAQYILVIIIILILFAPSFLTPLTDFERAKINVMRAFNKPRAHLKLSEIAAEASDSDMAQDEFKKAYLLLNSDSKEIAVISSEFEKVKRIAFVDEFIRQEIEIWENIVSEQLGYRDGNLRLALFYYQLGETNLATSYWREAWSLDPNSTEVNAVGKVLGISTDFGSLMGDN